MKRIFQGRHGKKTDRQTADLILVVLASQGITARVIREGDGRFEIQVPDQTYRFARSQLDRYQRENRIKAAPDDTPGGPLFLSLPILGLVGLLSLIHLFCIRTGFHGQAVFQYGASSYFIGQGEHFRAITALFLHSDFSHLLGNAAGFLALGSPLARLTGYGSALFFLLCAGTAGNLLACGLDSTARISIGASTAVMGAAGLLVARKVLFPGKGYGFALFPKLKGLAPLVAGATLMAMFSHGETTNVSAHFFGFGAGIGVGLIAFPLFSVWSGPTMERACLGLTLAITASALVRGAI